MRVRISPGAPKFKRGIEIKMLIPEEWTPEVRLAKLSPEDKDKWEFLPKEEKDYIIELWEEIDKVYEYTRLLDVVLENRN